MVANAEGTKSTKAVSKKRLSKTPTARKRVLSKKVLTKKSAVKKPAPSSKGSKSSASESSRSIDLSPSFEKLGSNSLLAVQSKPKESKQASQEQPMVVNLNLYLNFVMPDELSSPGDAVSGLTLNLNDIMDQQRAKSSSSVSSSGRRSTGQAVVKGAVMKKFGVQKPKYSKEVFCMAFNVDNKWLANVLAQTQLPVQPSIQGVLSLSNRGEQCLIVNSYEYRKGRVFFCAPKSFNQLYTINVFKGETTLPCVYALLPDKSTASYLQMFHVVKNLDIQPQSIMIDFESAAINTLDEVFENYSVSFCLFHLSKNAFANVQVIFKKYCKLLTAD